MKELNHEKAQVYIDAGCRVDGHRVVGSEAVVVSALLRVIGGRLARSLESLQEQGIGPEWVQHDPLLILKNAGWGTDREGNLVGSDYEIRRAGTIVDTLFHAAGYAPPPVTVGQPCGMAS